MKTKLRNNYRHKRAVLLFKAATAVFALLFHYVAVAQNPFSLTLTKTDQSCPGNGSLSFTTSGGLPGAPVTYRVYLLPDTANPVAVITNPSVQGLNAGSFSVTATQGTGSGALTDTKTIVIANTFVPLTYSLTGHDATCGPNGKIEVSVNSGTASSYEIMTGPVTRPPQSSPSLSGLPGGVYQVRVTDNCGNGIVVTHTVFSQGPILSVSPGGSPSPVLPGCFLVARRHTISVSNQTPIVYPLSLQWILYPPDGSPAVIANQTLTTGPTNDAIINHTFPLYYDTDYYYDLIVTDPCGNTYSSAHNLIHAVFTAGATGGQADCGRKFLKIAFDNVVLPCTINFTSFPTGFDPATFNPLHPGPFSGVEVAYGGQTMPVPWGNYAFTATDACGRSFSATIQLIPPIVLPESVGFNGDCATGLGSIRSRINDFTLATAIITAAPPAFLAMHSVPYDVSAFIDGPDGLKLEGMPPGVYTISLIDECGNTYPPEVITVPPYTGGTFGGNVRPDCISGKSTLRLTGNPLPLSAVTITGAPADAPFTTPYDATPLLNSDGNLYMDNLPPGTYTFNGASSCNPNMTTTLNLVAYTVTTNNYSLVPHCGSFDIVVNHSSTGNAFESLWLQKKLDNVNNVWGNPVDGTEYTEGTIPDTANSISITSGVMEYSLPYTGDFRILKRYQSFGSGGSDPTKNCFEVLQEFNYSGNLEIIDVKSVNCSGTNADVEVITNGVPPIHYTIQEKNYQPYFVDNGNNPVFTNLEPAVYTFRAEDSCGRFRSRSFNVAALPSLAMAYPVPGLHQCDTDGNGTETFDLSSVTATILGPQMGPQHSISYHTSQQDAENGANSLPLNFITGTTVVYARVLYTGPTSTCYATTSFPLLVTPEPALYMPDSAAICEGDTVTLTADAGYASYSWDGGPLTANYEVSSAGTYTVTVTDTYGCVSNKSVTVTSYQAPVIQSVAINDWTTSDNIITVHLENPSAADFLYSIDGVNYQQSPTFSGLSSGNYTVYVKDVNQCGNDRAQAVVLSYPKFFTPNGDGENETWRIKFAMAEPGLEVSVFDRFGKLISTFGPDGGWDGTYNGRHLPATDYWFVVRRQDGRILKGHFSMLR